MKKSQKLVILASISALIVGILTVSTSYAQELNCADMYSNGQGTYLVSEINGEHELRSDLYQSFWGIEDLKEPQNRGNCYFWMIAWIWR